LTRRRIAFLQDLADDLRDAARRRRRRAPQEPPAAPAADASDELQRRLDETRERLRREIPSPEDPG
jgi:hypothetical protein